ncbi:GNAT family N-acetyltransferase [Herbiconiux sp. L3-i23]|uniref:GNAT family N-acetyltransferase n=1 Tax=Herbiconiux sp. L3-i23 TaxID=2905871 RepID=UPI002058DAEA|nr:N-acetyltransferase [Herbiconiux sp. L3-i23]
MSDETTVRFDPDHDRYVAEVGGEYAGVAQFRPEGDDVWVFTHTVVDESMEGRGVGSALVRAALDGARENGKRIEPQCPFVAAYVRKHHDWDDLLEPPAA